MKKILTGIQATGTPHLGNILGALKPALQSTNLSSSPPFIFIADLHTLTTQKNSAHNKAHVHATAATMLALGLTPDKQYCYRQSRIPEVCELAWYFSCLTSYRNLLHAHAFKSKSENQVPNVGLFTYPILMTADILLFQATHIPVGQDQHQHLEIAARIARKFNQTYGTIFPEPQPLQQAFPTVVGTDGKKMSKSYGNTINPLEKCDEIRQAVMRITTDSTPLATAKNPDTCHIYNLYATVATSHQTAKLREKYLAGGYGYKAAKEELIQLLIEQYSEERDCYQYYMQHPKQVEEILQIGESNVRPYALETLSHVKEKMGYTSLDSIF